MAPIFSRLNLSKRFASSPNLGKKVRGNTSAPQTPPSEGALHAGMDVTHPAFAELLQRRVEANGDKVSLKSNAAATSSPKAETKTNNSNPRSSIRRSWSESDLDKLANRKPEIVRVRGVDFEMSTPPQVSPARKPKKSATYDPVGEREPRITTIVKSATLPIGDTIKSLKNRMRSISDFKLESLKKGGTKLSAPTTPHATENISSGDGKFAIHPDLLAAKRQAEELHSSEAVEAPKERKVISGNRILQNQANVEINEPQVEGTDLPVPDALKAFVQSGKTDTTKKAQSKHSKQASVASTLSTDTNFSNPFSRPSSFIGKALSPRPQQSSRYGFNLKKALIPMLPS